MGSPTAESVVSRQRVDDGAFSLYTGAVAAGGGAAGIGFRIRAAELFWPPPAGHSSRHDGAKVPQLQTPGRLARRFAFDLPDGGVMDGGDLFVAIDLESGSVAIRE